MGWTETVGAPWIAWIVEVISTPWIAEAVGAAGMALLFHPAKTANRIARRAAEAERISLGDRSDPELKRRLKNLRARRRAAIGQWSRRHERMLYGGYGCLAIAYIHRLVF